MRTSPDMLLALSPKLNFLYNGPTLLWPAILTAAETLGLKTFHQVSNLAFISEARLPNYARGFDTTRLPADGERSRWLDVTTVTEMYCSAGYDGVAS